MSASNDRQLILDRRFSKSYDPSIAGKVQATLQKLMTDSTTNGLHVEPIKNPADDRVRTARVDLGYRMVLFDLGQWYLAYGVYSHDDAYVVAQKIYARVNPTSGFAEIRDGLADASRSQSFPEKTLSDSELKALVDARAAELLARQQSEEEVEKPLESWSAAELVTTLGVDEEVAAVAVDRTTDELVAFLGQLGDWQADALMDLATGTPLAEVKAAYTVSGDSQGGTAVGIPSDSSAIARAATAEGAQSQFRLISDDKALAEALSSGDFESWRLFLHPDQREFVNKRTNGPFRLSGGAGTGKTVVLIHRAVRLAKQNPNARILVVSYTRNLVEMIREQIRSLDSSAALVPSPGRPGICVMTLDQVSRRVLEDAAGTETLSGAMESVLGWGIQQHPQYRSAPAHQESPWDSALDSAGDDLPENLRSSYFFQSEYQEVILPRRITDEVGYLRVARPGRGTRLGRAQRRAVWEVVAQYRKEALATRAIDWDEGAAVSAAVLTRGSEPRTYADHVLIDEGQDFSPTRWQLARALVASGPDDLFIAEDANQRIYGNKIVLGRYGIEIRGRARRLRLNYRTTEQNLRLALGVLAGGDYDLDESEEGATDLESHGGERYLSSRVGPVPELIRATDLADEYDRAAALLNRWSEELEQGGLATNTLGVLTRTKRERDHLVRALGERGVSATPVDKQDIPASGPAVMTLHRAKGTEFARVLLFGVSESSIPKFFTGSNYDHQAQEENQLRERSLLYVGATRARDMLAISWNKEASPYLPKAGAR